MTDRTDASTARSWLAEHGGTAASEAIDDTPSSLRSQDRFAGTVEDYYVNTDELTEWFSHTTDDIYDTTRRLTVYRTGDPDQYVLYERRLIERDRTISEAIKTLLLPGRAICSSDAHDAKGLSIIMAYSAALALIGSLPAAFFTDPDWLLVLFVCATPGLTLLAGEYRAAPSRGVQDKTIRICDSATLQNRLRGRDDMARSELPESLQRPSIADDQATDDGQSTDSPMSPLQKTPLPDQECPKCGSTLRLNVDRRRNRASGVCVECRLKMGISHPDPQPP